MRRPFDWTRDPIRVRVTDAPVPPPIIRSMAKELLSEMAARINRLETAVSLLVNWCHRMSQQKEKRRIKRMKTAVRRAKAEATTKHLANANINRRIAKPKKHRGAGRKTASHATTRNAKARAR